MNLNQTPPFQIASRHTAAFEATQLCLIKQNHQNEPLLATASPCLETNSQPVANSAAAFTAAVRTSGLPCFKDSWTKQLFALHFLLL